MKRLLLLVVLAEATALGAQPVPGAASTPLYIGSDRPRARVVLSGAYQQVVDGDREITQIATPISLFLPLARTLSVSINVAGAMTEGDGLETMYTVTDAQVAASLRVPVGPARVVAHVGASIPKSELPVDVPTEVDGSLTEAEAATAFLVGQPFYGFRVPTSGQGLNIAPGLTVVVPIGDRLAIGAGASFQSRGSFEPLADVEGSYEPGAETLVTGGLDVRLGAGSAVSADLTYARYEPDVWVGDSYRTGDVVAVTGQVQSALGVHEVRLLGRVERKGESEVPPSAVALVGIDSSVPFQARASGQIRFRLGRWARLGLAVQGRHYDASEVFPEMRLVDATALPELRLGQVSLFGRFGLTTGSFERTEMGGGLAVGL